MALLLSFFLLSSLSKAEAPIVEHTIVDDGYAIVPLDFGFQFYGNTYYTSVMMTNGVVGFLAPESYDWGLCCNGQDLDNYAQFGSRFDFTLMPLWTDLISINGVGKFYTQGDENSMKYMWKNLSEYYRPDSRNDFDMTIYPLGNIDMSYRKIDIKNHSVTVGIVANLSEQEYEQWFYHQNQEEAVYWDSSESDPIVLNNQSICEVVPESHISCAWYPQQYAENFLAAECAKDSLYSQACPNWETAWLNQQCEESSQSSPYCPNYQEPVIEEVYEEIETVYDIIPETYIELDLLPALNDYSIDLTLEIETNIETFEEMEMDIEEFEAEIEAEIESMLEPEIEPEPVEEVTEEVLEEEVLEEEIVEEAAPEEVPEEVPEETIDENVVMLAEAEPKPEKTKEQIKNDKLNQIVAIKLGKLSQQRAVATTLEEQSNLEAYIIALLNFNAGFKNYNVLMPDGVGYDSKNIYTETYIPDNKKALRNGLAQELLHKQMVDLQWQN